MAAALDPVVPGSPLMVVEDLVVHFRLRGRGSASVRAVDGVSLTVDAGRTLGVIGESGSGKSTLGRGMLQLVPATGGRVVFRGVEPAALSGRERRELQARYQMIFQDPLASLDPRMKVLNSVTEPLVVHGVLSKADRTARALELLERVGLTAAQAQRFPHELSGGQRQRVNIARALTLQPDLLVCDESVAALDVALQAEILNLFVELQRDLGVSYVFITHDLSVAAHIADRIGVMYLGRLMELGPADAVVSAPLHPYTEALLSAQPLPVPRYGQTVDRILLEGDIPSPVDPPSGCRFRTRCPYARQRCADEVPKWRELTPGHAVACHFSEELSLRSAADVVPVGVT
jgi:peptide/nickel transport system ATP-binding protein/oligopeptide transport system ATP-binding protein